MNIPSNPAQKTQRRLFSAAALYGLSDIAVLAVGGFLLLPVYTHSLSQAEFGHYVAVRANIDIATYILQLGLPSAVARLYFDRKRDGQEDAYLSGVIIFFCIFAVISVMAGIAFGPWLWNAISPTVPIMPALPFTLAIATAGGLGSLTIVWLRSEHRVATVVATQVSAALVLAALAIFFLVELDMGLAGILAGLLASTLLPAIALIGLFGRRFRIVLRRADIVDTLHYALPILVGYLAYFALNRSGLLLLQRNVSANELAVFGLAQQLSMIAALACSSFGAALQPTIFGAEQQDVRKLLDQSSYQLTLIMLAVCSALMMFADDLVKVIAPDGYAGSAVLLLVLIAANFTNTFSLLSDTMLLYHHRPKTSVLISVASAVIATALGLLLVPEWHTEGAAISVAAGLTFRMIVSQWVAWRISGQSQAGLAIPALAVIALVAITASLLREASLPLMAMMSIKLVICTVAVGIFYLFQKRFSSDHE